MTEVQKTIRMPKKLLAKWLKALRTGGYEQAELTMYDPQTYGFCCLGVLQHCVTKGEVEADEYGFNLLPSEEWLATYGISFTDSEGASDDVPWLPSLRKSASFANDTGASFKAIARAVERCAEGY